MLTDNIDWRPLTDIVLDSHFRIAEYDGKFCVQYFQKNTVPEHRLPDRIERFVNDNKWTFRLLCLFRNPAKVLQDIEMDIRKEIDEETKIRENKGGYVFLLKDKNGIATSRYSESCEFKSREEAEEWIFRKYGEIGVSLIKEPDLNNPGNWKHVHTTDKSNE